MHLLLLLVNLIILKNHKINGENDAEFFTGNEYGSNLLKIFGDTNKMNLYKFFIPFDSSTVIFNFDIVFVSNCHLFFRCSEYEVVILLQYGSYPYTIGDDEIKPKGLLFNSRKQYMLKVDRYQVQNASLEVKNPEFGYWFASVQVQTKSPNQNDVLYGVHRSFDISAAASMLYAKQDVVILSDNQIYFESVNSSKIYHFKLFVDNTNEFTYLKISASLPCASCTVKICTRINKLAGLKNCVHSYTFDWLNGEQQTFRFDSIQQTWIYIRVEADRISDVSEFDTDFSFELTTLKTSSVHLSKKMEKFLPIKFFNITRIENSNIVFFYDKQTKTTSSLTVEPLATYILKFYLHEILDIKKTLIVALQLITPNKKKVKVNGCFSSNIISYPTKDGFCLNEIDISYESNIGLRNESLGYAQVLYPKSGWWYLSLRNEGFIPTKILIDIKLKMCLMDSCFPNGFCSNYVSNNLDYFTCSCENEFSGLDCGQSSSSEIDDQNKFALALLTFSNLCFIPSIVLAFKKQLTTESGVYFCTMIISSIYHLCDTDHKHCIVALSVVQTCDFYCGLMSIWVTIIAISKVPMQTKSFLHIVGSIFLVFGIDYDKHSFWVFLVPFFVGLLIIFTNFIYFYRKNGKLMYDETYWRYNLPIGIVLAFIGLLCFAFVQSAENYHYVHSLWHLLMALSILFFL